jgi:hypothetical protein
MLGDEMMQVPVLWRETVLLKITEIYLYICVFVLGQIRASLTLVLVFKLNDPKEVDCGREALH